MGRLVVFACLLIFPAITRADDKEDWKKLAGKWSVIGMELGGQKFNAENLGEAKLLISEGKYELSSKTVTDKGTLKIDSGAKPRSMDIAGTEGPNKGKTILAIYDFDGDVLRICYGLKGDVRPKAFQTTKEDGFFLAVYKKDK